MNSKNIENNNFYSEKAKNLSFTGFYICPVCGFPHNFEFKSGEICECCKWQDDNISDYEASYCNKNFSCRQYRHLFFNHIRNTKTESIIKKYKSADTKQKKFKAYTDWIILNNKIEFKNNEEKKLFVQKYYHQANLYYFLKNLQNSFNASEENQFITEDIKEKTHEDIFSEYFLSEINNKSKIDKIINLISKMDKEKQSFFVEFFIYKIYRTIFNNPEKENYVYFYNQINNNFKIKTNDFHFIKGKLMSLSNENNLHLRGNVTENLIKLYYKLSGDTSAKKALESIKWLQNNFKEGL